MEHIGGNQATPNVDFNAITNNSVIIRNGETFANITLSIFDDPNPELSELFDVELEHVELVGQTPAFPPQLGALKRAAVTIVTSDDAHGLMVIKAANPDAGSHGSRTTVNESDRLSVFLHIERLKGKLFGYLLFTEHIVFFSPMSLLDKNAENGPSDIFAPNLVVGVLVICHRAD